MSYPTSVFSGNRNSLEMGYIEVMIIQFIDLDSTWDRGLVVTTPVFENSEINKNYNDTN